MRSSQLLKYAVFILLIAMISGIYSAAAVPDTDPSFDIVFGDINLSGYIDAEDISIMTAFLSGENTTGFSAEQFELRSDVNADGLFDIQDITLAVMISAEKTEAPVRKHKCSFSYSDEFEASCTEGGYTLYSCSRCGIEYREYTSEPFGHNLKKDKAIAPTCEKDGYTLYNCSRCEAKEKKDFIKASGHKWEKLDTIKPSCLLEGYTTYKCSVCRKIKCDDYSAPYGHSWEKQLLKNDNGSEQYYFVCTVCGEKKSAAPPMPQKNGSYAGVLTIDTYLGAKDTVEFLIKHSEDYLGTKYVSLRHYYGNPHGCLQPAGFYPDAPGLNCTGFVASVFEQCGGDLSLVPSLENGLGASGSYANGFNWRRLFENSGVFYYKFYTIKEALDSGKMQKGDIIYFQPARYGLDCHLGIFWGENGHDDKIWHSIAQGNCITNIKCAQAYAYMYVIPVQH
jgi:hypothetical protein